MNDELSVVVHDGSGPYLLLVHGMLASRSQWLLNLPAFSEFTRPVTVELWGHHLSPSPVDSEAYKPLAYARLFDAIREQLGIERWFVGGCSLGAALTMRYALEYSDHVIGQFLTNSSSAFADESMSRTMQENSEASYQRLLEGGKAAIERIPVHPRFAKRLPEDVRSALLADCAIHTVDGIAGTMRWTSPYASVRSDLRSLKLPSMLLCGSFERRFQPLRSYAMKHVPNLVIHDLPAGHGVNMEAADAFNEKVRTFVLAHSLES